MYGGPIGTHQRSFGRYHPRLPMASPSLRLGVCNLATASYLKNMDFIFGGYIYRANLNKSPLNILEKMERGRIQGLPNVLGVPPIIPGTGKATDFKFCRNIHRTSIGTKSP